LVSARAAAVAVVVVQTPELAVLVQMAAAMERAVVARAVAQAGLARHLARASKA
jgi:hypothetical protein